MQLLVKALTAPFSKMRIPKFKARPTDALFATVNQMFGGSSQLPTTQCRALFRCLNCTQRFDHRVLDSSRKLGEVAENLIDGSEKPFCRLSFEF